MRKTAAIVMAAAAVGVAAAAFGATVNIGTLEELQLFMQNAHNPPYYAGDTVKLTADIDCGGGQFTSGYSRSGTVFKGTFDGQGHKIFNFSNKGNSPGTGQQGDYGVAMFDIARDGAVIKNLTLEGNFDDGAASPEYAAAFVAYAIGNTNGTLGLTLENCHFKGRVSNYRSAAAFVGQALHGTGAPDGRVLYMTNCTANGTVWSDYSYVVGGLVANGEAVEAADCSFEGAATGRWTLGGLIGRAVDCSFKRCSFEGTLGPGPGGLGGSNGGCGGLVGFASNSVFRACSADAENTWDIDTGNYDSDGRIYSHNFTANGGAAGLTCGSSAFYDCTAAGTLLAKHGYGGGFVGWTAGSEIFSNCVTEVTLQPDAKYSNTHGHGGFASTVASDGALFVDCTTRSQGNNIVGGFFNNQHPRKDTTVGANTFRRCRVEDVPAEDAGFCMNAWNCIFDGCTVRGGTGAVGFVYTAGQRPSGDYSWSQTNVFTDCFVVGTRVAVGFVGTSNLKEVEGSVNEFHRCRAGCVYDNTMPHVMGSAGFAAKLYRGSLAEDCVAYGIEAKDQSHCGFADSISGQDVVVRRCVSAGYPVMTDPYCPGFASTISYYTTVEDCYSVYGPRIETSGLQGGFVEEANVGYNSIGNPITRCFALGLIPAGSVQGGRAGAFAGKANNTSYENFVDCYRPEESPAPDVGNIGDDTGVGALSRAEFATATAATMPNYDFVNVWHAPNGAASSPYLDASVDENGDFWFLAAVLGAEGRILVDGKAPKEAYAAGARLKVKAVADNPDLPFAGWVGEGFDDPTAQETWYTVKNVSAIGAAFCTPIYTVNDWTNKMRASSTENFALMADLDFTDYLATNDWSFLRVDNFQGKFFGQGHTIRGLVSTNGDFSTTRALFDKIANGAEIRDLTVESAVYPIGGVDGKYNTVCMAGLVREVDYHGEFPSWGYATSKYYGLAYNVRGTDIRIVDCTVEGTMAGCSEVAGLIGYADLTGGEIARCSAMGYFSATNSQSMPYGRASGFAGEITLRNGSTVRECFAAGVVEGAYYGSGFAYQIALCDDQSTVRDCYSTAEVATREGGGINDYGNATGFAQRINDNNDEGGATVANCWFGGTARALSDDGHSYGFAWILDGDVTLRNCAFVQSDEVAMEGTAGVAAISKVARLSAGSWGGDDIGGAWTMESGKTTPYFAWSLKDGGFRVFAMDETEGTSISHPETAEGGTQSAVAGDTELALAVDTWLGAAGYADGHAPETTFLADNHRTLRCTWKAAAPPVSNVTQTVTFDANGGTPATQTATYEQGGKYDPLAAEEPTLADRVFGGWFSLPEGGAEITTNSTVTAVSNRTVYAHWRAFQTVTFEPNGGECDPQGAVYEVGFPYEALATAVREGYTLAGWFDAAEGGTQVSPAMTVAEPGAKTLYAHWSANQYSVNLLRVSGSGGTTNVLATFGSPMPDIKPPTGYTGHTFEGYWTERDGGGTQYYNGDGTSARDWDIAAATNLYGYWPGNRYTATFDKQGGTGGSSNAAVTYDQLVPAVTIPARTGYDFQGYFTEPNGKGVKYWDYDGSVNQYWNLTEDRTFYASWLGKFYSVSFDKQGGSGGWGSAGVYYGDWLPDMGELPTKDGYTFGGYWSQPNGGGTQYYAADGTGLLSWTTDGNGVLYAKWMENGAVVTLDRQGGTGGTGFVTATYGSAMPGIALPTRSGYTFGGYYSAANGGGTQYYTAAGKSARTWNVAGNATLYAKWTENGSPEPPGPIPPVADRFTVRFHSNGGSGTMAAQAIPRDVSTALLANVFTRKDHTFLGWAKSAGGAVVYNDKAMVKNLAAANGTATLYAQWAKTKYTVAFKANGGKGKMAKQKMTYGKAAKLRKNAFKRKGYVFLGWAKTKKGAVAYKNRAKVKNLRTDGKTTTLYAKWAKKNYSVAFKANGGTGTMAKQKMTYGKAAKLKKNAFERKGYVFLGWAKTKKGAVAYKNRATVKNLRTDGKTTTLYAKWAKTSYQVAFDANGGSGTMAKQTMTYGKSAKLKKNAFALEGHTFAGWAKTKTGAVAYKDEASVKNLRTDGKTTTLYAVWTQTRTATKSVKSAEKGAGEFLQSDGEESVAEEKSQGLDGAGAAGRVLVTASGGENAEAVADGNMGTAWTADAENGAWVVLAFPEALDVGDVEVAGENLPEGIRFLLSEDAEEWREEVPGRARYVWVAFPASGTPLVVREIRVVPE